MMRAFADYEGEGEPGRDGDLGHALLALLELEKTMQAEDRRQVSIEYDGEVEIGRNCPLDQWILALEIGLFRNEWRRQRKKAKAWLATLGPEGMGLEPRRTCYATRDS